MQPPVFDYRRKNFRSYLDANGGPKTVAPILGFSNSSYIVQMTGPKPTRPISEKNARKFEHLLKLDAGYLDREVPEDEEEYVPANKSIHSNRTKKLAIEQIRGLMEQVRLLCIEEGVTPQFTKFEEMVSLALEDLCTHNGHIRQDHIKMLIRLAK